MGTVITHEKLDELLFTELELDDEESSQEAFLVRSHTAELWATGKEFELEDEAMPVALFTVASRQAEYAGDLERALAMARRGVDGAEGLHDWMVPDVRIQLYSCLRQSGREAEAAELERNLRRLLPDELESFDEMGQVLARLGEMKLAERWYTIGIRFAEEHGLTDDFDYELLVVARSELREDAELPKDEFDLLAEEIVVAWDFEPGD